MQANQKATDHWTKWCNRVQGWISLYQSGHLLSRTNSPAFEQIVSCLEREAIQGEILERLLPGNAERAAVHRIVARLDQIAGELCDRRRKIAGSPVPARVFARHSEAGMILGACGMLYLLTFLIARLAGVHWPNVL